jgi:hypothetical protein
MTIMDTISSAGRNQHTIMITARENAGCVETREAEPYSYTAMGGHEEFFCYDIRMHATRNIHVSKIMAVKETAHSFFPRWSVDV